jgi:hypothetical protein
MPEPGQAPAMVSRDRPLSRLTQVTVDAIKS